MKHKLRSSPPAWVADAVFYQIFPERFRNGDHTNDPDGVSPWGKAPTRESFSGGDLQGVLDSLDHLKWLGVTAVYLNPIFAARTNHRYDTSDYFRVDPALGDISLLQRLVQKMHGLGMRLILDGVFNHCGDGFAPFVDVLEHGPHSEYRDWFVARSYPLRTSPLNYLTCGGCHYLPKLNHAHPPVREFLLRVAQFWLREAGVDGWRLDVPFKIPMGFWREFRAAVTSINPDAYLVGEVWRDARPWIQGDTFDGTTNYRLRELIFDYALTEFLDAEDLAFEVGTLADSHGTSVGAMLNLLGSHDTPRVFTEFAGDVERLRIALTLQMTLPGAPMIYYGDEVGLRGGADPDCRRCMPWDKTSWNHEILETTRALVALRHEHVALRRARPETLAAFNGVLAYRMALHDDEVIVVVNPREAVPNFAVPVRGPLSQWRDVLTRRVWAAEGGVITLDPVPPCSAHVLVPVR